MNSNNIDSDEVQQWLQRMSAELRSLIANDNVKEPVKIVGIKTGGVVIAHHLQRLLGVEDPVGELNISFYRDDFSRIGLHPRVGASNIPYSIDGETIVLVDDVLYSGRTVRAAMNELFDFGRPERIILATLVERNGRELPVCADVVGCKMRLDQNETIKLTDDLSLVVKSI
jgi:pyrimidine operon attenuation protein/uracil phosphoribosyltransferase